MYLVFFGITMTCLGFIPSWDCTDFLNFWISFFHHFWKHLIHYLFRRNLIWYNLASGTSIMYMLHFIYVHSISTLFNTFAFSISGYINLNLNLTNVNYRLLWGSDGKESTFNAGDPGLILGLERSPREGNGYPLQFSCLENSMDRGAWRATAHAVVKSWAWLSD